MTDRPPPEIRAFKSRLTRRAMEVFGQRGYQAAIARACDTTTSTVCKWFDLTAASMPGGDRMLLLPDVLQCSADWLLLGRGPPERIRGDEYQRGVSDALAEMDRVAARLRNGRG